MSSHATTLKNTELKRFLEQYMKNRRLADTPQSYADFLLGEGKDPAGDAEGSFRAALRAEAKAQPTYGSEGETLARAGLADSGYAAQRKDRAARALAEKQERIETQKRERERENQSAYARYIETFEQKKEKAESAAQKSDTKRRAELIEKLYDYHIEDMESARVYAEGLGYGDIFSKELFDAAMVLLKYRGGLEIIDGNR